MPASTTKEATAGGMEVLTFDLQGETFALEAIVVREILDHAPATPVPGAAEFVKEVINFRGRVIPLADLRLAFNLEPVQTTLDSRIIVIAFDSGNESSLIGLRADKVHEVTTLDMASTEPAPRIGMRWRQDFIRCLAKRRDDVIVVPDLEQIFAARGRPDGVASPLGAA